MALPFWLVKGKINLWRQSLRNPISVDIYNIPSRINFSLHVNKKNTDFTPKYNHAAKRKTKYNPTHEVGELSNDENIYRKRNILEEYCTQNHSQ